MNLAPFIDGSYGITTAFLAGISILALLRYSRAARRLTQLERDDHRRVRRGSESPDPLMARR